MSSVYSGPVADGFSPTRWRKPDTGEIKLMVQFRIGYVDTKNPYTADQLRWSDTGHDWDVIAIRRWD